MSEFPTHCRRWQNNTLETEFEKYRIIQDRLFESDFDRFELPTLPFDEEKSRESKGNFGCPFRCVDTKEKRA